MAEINRRKRITLNIPIGTELHEYLSKNNNQSRWEMLNDMVKHLPKTKEEKAIDSFEKFIEDFCSHYPDVKTGLNYLRPFIFQQLVMGKTLDPEYFEELKKS